MVLHLSPGERWEFTPSGAGAEVTFASASSPGDPSRLTVSVNGAEVDSVALPVPHSWWPLSGQTLCPALGPADVLVLEAGDAPVDVRLDLTEHEA